MSLPEPGNLVIKDFAYAGAEKKGQAIVKMEMCGICGSDVTAFRGEPPPCAIPLTGWAMRAWASSGNRGE